MSKLWSVHPSYLDDSRLLREHQSVHKLLHDAVRKTGKPTQGRFHQYGGYLVLRHFLDVCEMRLRGMRHESFVDDLWKQIPEGRRLILYRYTKEDIIEDINRLRPKQHNAVSSRSTGGRTALAGIPEELNQLAEKTAREGFPRDIFLL